MTDRLAGRLPAALTAYRVAATALVPLVPAWLARRVKRGKEDPDRLAERRGWATIDRPDGDLVWAHGASIGESLSLLPLVEAIARRGTPVLVTSGTRTAAEILARRLPAGARHQYVPLDAPPFWRRFLDYWQPHAALFAESEIWPGAVIELARREVPLILVNARMSERSFAGWSRAPGVARALMSRVALGLAQGEADARRLTELGVPSVGVAGNLKFDIAPPPADPAAVERLGVALARRTVWLAASTHPGEEGAVIAAHHAARARLPRLLTILAPRHPTRTGEVAGLLAAAGLSVQRRSQGGEPGEAPDVYLVDTVGELGLFFRAAPLAFMGGSLMPHGGHNPIEPARLGAAILHGPDVANHAEVYAALAQAGGALRLADGAALAAALPDLLADPAGLRGMARAASVAVEGFSGALERTMRAIEPYLPPARPDRVTVW